MNRERHALLREAERKFDGAPPISEILRALLAPPILWRDPALGKATASRFISRAMAETTPELRKILESDVSHLKGVSRAARTRVARSQRERSLLGVAFRGRHSASMHRHNFKRVKALSGGQCDIENVEAVLARAIRFAEGGMSAIAASAGSGGARTRAKA